MSCPRLAEGERRLLWTPHIDLKGGLYASHCSFHTLSFSCSHPLFIWYEIRVISSLQRDLWLRTRVPQLQYIHNFVHNWQQGLRLYFVQQWLQKWYSRTAFHSRREAADQLELILNAFVQFLRESKRFCKLMALCLERHNVLPDLGEIIFCFRLVAKPSN